MENADHVYTLPDDLPVPEDDGAADHLLNAVVPAIGTKGDNRGDSAAGRAARRTILFCYPRTGRPDEPLLPGWDAIPGARGCTPETCGFRDAHSQFADLGARVIALSTQSSDYQREMAERLGLPFPVLSDESLAFTEALGLPTFETAA